MMFPLEPLLTSLPPESEDVVSATVVASSTSGSARTGRIVASTGSSTIEIRTAGLDAGDPENGNWWAIFEPAAGRARLVIAPATLDRDTFSLSGVPTDQPGIVALIQTPALEIDAATQTVYAPWGFAGDWRRYASAWYQTVLWQPMAGLVELRAVVAPEHDLAQVHSTEPNTVLAAGAERQFRVLPARAERILNVPCDVPVVRVEVLNFGEVIAEGDATLRPAEAGTFTGSCAAGDASWPLRLLARSLNGRAVGVLLQSLPDEVMP
jgi:hypothetical protein